MSDSPLSHPRQGPFRNGRRAARSLPLLVWCGSIVAVVLLLPQSGLRSPIRGLVDTTHHVVRAPVAGRLATLTVELHEPVKAGQVIGRLADDDVRLHLSQARLELERLRAELKRREAELEVAGQSADSNHKPDNATVPKDLVLEPLRWQLKIREAELERITFDLGRLDLTAPCNGNVASLSCRAGHWLVAGDAVLSITEPAARRILAYVPEPLRDQVAPSRLVHLFRPDRAGSRRTASVRSISPALVPVPRRLLRDPRTEEWAWEVVLDASGDEAPGESIQLLLPPP